jgi:Tol biopolymer transport system component
MRPVKRPARRRFGLATGSTLVALLLVSPLARATAPGPNGLIAFRADTGRGNQIYTMPPDGTGQRQLTNLPGDALQPHWSPESNRIAFEFDPAASDSCAHVAFMNPNGGDMTVLPEANGDQCEGSPTFSADGERIFYEGFDGANRDAIFSTKLNGKDRQLVTACQGEGASDPEVSPDGTMLSFTCFSPDGDAALFDSRVDGSGLRQLTPFSFEVGSKADWSPDSRRIMFITQMAGAVNTATIRPDGTGLMWVTSYGPGRPYAFGNS